MAQAQVASMPSAIKMAAAPSSLPKDELRQIEEYGRIISFRDRVLSGKHPTIKVPAHLAGAKSAASSQPIATASPPTAAAISASATAATASHAHPTPSPGRQESRNGAVANRQALQTNSMQPPVTTNFPGLGSLPANGRSRGVASAAPNDAPVKLFNPARAEINPIFLEKSDHLVKTEIQLQRQRIERALREQLEQKRSSGGGALQPSEPLPDFDLMDVLQKALVLVEQTAPPSTDANVAANNNPEDSDSFDENTFYSSQFDDSPSSAHVARIANNSEPQDVDMRESPDYEPEPSVSIIPTSTAEPRPAVPEKATRPLHKAPPPPNRASPDMPAPIPYTGQPTSDTRLDRLGLAPAPASLRRPFSHQVQVVSSHDSGDASGSTGSGVNTDNEQSADDLRSQANGLARNANAFEGGCPAVVRAHDLSPLAPQPSHVSPLATARNPPEVGLERQALQGAPAQVAALRNEPTAVSSPESSPQAGKANDKRKGKKKNKRKADREAVDASPYIKNEPRSPSPLSAAPAARPHKRLRPIQRPMEALSYDEPAYTVPPTDGYSDRHGGQIYHEEAPRIVYERRDSATVRDGGAPPITASTSLHYEPDVYEVRRPPTTTQFVRESESSGLYPTQYGPSEPRLRSVSHTVVDRPYREAPIYYRDVRDEPRMSVRPAAERKRSRSPIMREVRGPTMAPPPRAQATRIYIDEFGREYIEPPRSSAVARQSVAPSSRPVGNIVYDHPPPPARAASRMSEPYGDGVIYRRVSSPAYAAPRRVITEPEYVGGDYRAAYRQREYAPPQAGPHVAEEYAQTRPAQERQPVDDPGHARDYLTRAASVRPAEPVRYDISGHYGERPGSVRPELIREYGVAAHPETRREVVHQQFAREYSVRPEAQVIQRPYSTRPVEQHTAYYEGSVRRNEEVAAFIERPRGGLEGVVYTEAPRREAYR
ncbi:hypothetical protein GGTG_02931 [Gaeumannomyces tritici R3-111a-1]|uniref:Uncharacterized protein n=1 Tax=Gaeumannomyces tritici (strain R3-111a-1) TaxID=644352 RepID=J3NNS5_GAET3|nr:hypothetical protein GGTG_02931 [Gaeumannomyces tritici R3-111a-1]EJT77828.1 hypothetical protein GGTG_02931 [Gaeumannomyces tritici R3-111a-1]